MFSPAAKAQTHVAPVVVIGKQIGTRAAAAKDFNALQRPIALPQPGVNVGHVRHGPAGLTGQTDHKPLLDRDPAGLNQLRMRFFGNLKAGEQRIQVRLMPVVIVVLKFGMQPFPQSTVLVDFILRKPVQHGAPTGHPVLLDTERFTRLTKVVQHLAADRDVHRRIDGEQMHALADGGVLGRKRGGEHQFSVRTLKEKILVEVRHFSEPRHSALGQEFPVAGEKGVVVEKLRQPARRGDPVCPDTWKRLTVRGLSDRHKNPSAPVELPGILTEVVHEAFEVIEEGQGRFRQVPGERLPIVHLYVFIVVKIRVPGRGVIPVPDALQVGRPAARMIGADQQIAPELEHGLN